MLYPASMSHYGIVDGSSLALFRADCIAFEPGDGVVCRSTTASAGYDALRKHTLLDHLTGDERRSGGRQVS